MFSMTSFDAKIDESINTERGPYVFKVSGQIEAFGGIDNLDPGIVEGLIHFLDAHNELVQLLRTAREKCREMDVPKFKIRLYNGKGARDHELPTSNTLRAMVFESGITSNTYFDVIIEHKDGLAKRINKLHRLYMSLQFPLFFIYGQSRYHTKLNVIPVDGSGEAKWLTMLANMVRTSRQNPTPKASLEPNPDIATIIAQQLQNILPQIVTQVTANVNNANGENGNCGNNGCSYKTFTASLTWWNIQVQARGQEAAIGMSWNDFKALLVEELCLINEMEKLENEF
ncbi:hypothetical protein Tco_1407739 [Tanacetum coccineum]